jgi:neutral ceramidase
MARCLGLWLTAVLGLTVDAVFAGDGTLKDSTLKVGAYAQDITPPRFPISVNGSMTDHLAVAAHDPLQARCLVLANSQTQLALVVCDSCVIPREIVDSARRRASYRTGIPAANMLIAATHAHSCPTVAGVFQSDPDENYREFLADRIADAIERAWQRLEPGQIGWTTAVDDTQVFNRRWRLKDGMLEENPFGQKVDRVRMNPGFNNPHVVEPVGPVDPQISVLSAQSRDGRPIAVLANYGLHYVGGVPGNVVSADYFGEFAARLNRLLGEHRGDGECVVIMSNGTSGDVNNVNFRLTMPPKREPFEQIGIVADSVAQKVAAVYGSIAHTDDVVLASVDTELTLGVRKPSAAEVAAARQLLEENPERPLKGLKLIYARETVLLHDFPDTVNVRLQALRIGDLASVSSPCETFAETGLAIKRDSPFRHTFVIELANGYHGYLPTPQQHEWGGYETWRARSSYLAVDAEPKVRNTLLELLHQLKALPR